MLETTNAILESDERQPDPAGRDRIAWNVAASWGCHLVFIAAGFVLPRMIDRSLGQTSLGIWDFGWSLVSYFALAQFGIIASVNRYVARYRAAGDVEGINRSVSSISCVLLVVAALVVALSAAATWLVPHVFADKLGDHVRETQWVIMLLGTSLAFEFATGGIGGVVTGLHRWDLHNLIHAGAHVLSVGGMIAALSLGWGLPGLALVHLIGEAAGRISRCALAFRLCPTLKVGPRLATWSEARSMIRFGGKSFVPDLSGLMLNQTISVLVLAYLGPVALAIYSRPRALVRQVAIVVAKFAYVLTPTASSLQALGREDDLREVLVKSTRAAAFIAIPMILLLAVMGDPLLRSWMGPGYACGPVLTILALGQLAAIVQLPAVCVLTGMNLHGRPGAANLVASGSSVVLAVIALSLLGAGLGGVALAIALPATLINALYVPVRACRCVKISVRDYVGKAFAAPLACSVPFVVGLLIVRTQTQEHPVVALVGAAIVGIVTLGPLYWRYAVPESIKRAIYGRVWLTRVVGAPAANG